MLKFFAKILVFVTPLLGANLLYASPVKALYDVEILVADVSTATRNVAFEHGLNEVFIRISGDSIVMDRLERPTASRYVKQFSYEPLAEPEVKVDPEGYPLTHKLKIQYNGSAMEKYLLKNGLPVWDKHRPEVVVWLVVRDGKNEYVLKENDQSQIKTTVNKVLKRRGISYRWPLYDAKDKKLLDVADIRGGFKEPVLVASKRYTNGPALAGSIIWSGKQWQSNWSLLVGNENRHWNLSDGSHKRLINDVLDQAADSLGALYAIHNNSGRQPLTRIQVEIQSINSVEKFRYVENYLANLTIVESSQPLKLDGQNAIFVVILRSSEEDFLSLIKSDATFSKVKPREAGTKSSSPPLSKENSGKELASVDNKNKQIDTPVSVKKMSVYRYKLMK